jgi:hypothetical protein
MGTRARHRPDRAARGLLVALAFAVAGSGIAHAAHPFITEDPGTQGAGHIGIELGFAAANGDPGVDGRTALFSPQLTIGVLPNLDFIGQGVWVRQSPAEAPTLFGSGDLMADVKWRFYDSNTWSFGVRAGLDLPTGDSSDGLGAGAVGAHAIGIAGLQVGAWAMYANAAYARSRAPAARANLGAFSIAVTQTETTPWQAFVEAATYSNPDPTNGQWPAVARTGLIYSVGPWLDLDAGFQARLNRSAARAVWLAGATFRW